MKAKIKNNEYVNLKEGERVEVKEMGETVASVLKEDGTLCFVRPEDLEGEKPKFIKTIIGAAKLNEDGEYDTLVFSRDTLSIHKNTIEDMYRVYSEVRECGESEYELVRTNMINHLINL